MSAPIAPVSTPSGSEMAALRGGVGFVERLSGDRLDLVGADRVRFLNNLATCDVSAVAPSRTARGFLTLVKGGVLADFDLVALADRLRLALPAGRGEAVAAHLSNYRIAERVEVESRTDLGAIGLRGERAPELFAALDLVAPAYGERIESVLEGTPLGLRLEPREGPPRFELELATRGRDGVVAALRSAGDRLGLVDLSHAALELARIEAFELAWGVDYGEENFPQETGEESAVSYTKGCYLGQEVVARIHYRGGVQRLPRRFRFEPGADVGRGAELTLDGRVVGRVTSLALEPESRAPVGLGLVHRRAADAGTRLGTSSGAVAVVEAR